MQNNADFLCGGDEKLFSAQKKFRVKKVCQNYSIADAISRNLVLKLFCAQIRAKKYKITKFARKKSSRKKVRAKKGPGVQGELYETPDFID